MDEAGQRVHEPKLWQGERNLRPSATRMVIHFPGGKRWKGTWLQAIMPGMRSPVADFLRVIFSRVYPFETAGRQKNYPLLTTERSQEACRGSRNRSRRRNGYRGGRWRWRWSWCRYYGRSGCGSGPTLGVREGHDGCRNRNDHHGDEQGFGIWITGGCVRVHTLYFYHTIHQLVNFSF